MSNFTKFTAIEKAQQADINKGDQKQPQQSNPDQQKQAEQGPQVNKPQEHKEVSTPK